MEVSRLAVVKRVPTRCRGVIARRLVGKRSKCEAIGVKKRWCKSPWLIRASGGRVLVLDVLMVRELTVFAVIGQYLSNYTSEGDSIV